MKNHYEVLNLKKNCSAKDIKDSFIELSKKYHPDRNKTIEAHKKFVEVNEAYSVLGKALSRSKYDDFLLNSHTYSGEVYRSAAQAASNHAEYYKNVYSTYYRQPDGEKTWGPFSKQKTFLFCCILMAIGTGIRFMVLWKEMNRREAHNKEISATLSQVKARAKKLGKEQAVIEMRKALVKDSERVDRSTDQ